MPLSFRRSYKKLPAADLDRNKRRVARTLRKKTAVAVPAEFRPRRYPAAIPIGCGLVTGLCLFFVISQGYVHLPSVPGATPLDAAAAPTMSTGTMPAEPSSTPQVMPVTATSSPMPTQTMTPISTEAASPANPWAADVPDAACIPADLPQTGRVVEVLNGDTIKVLMDSDGRVYSVRYLGLEAPVALDGPGGLGLEALARNSELVYHKQAVMVRDITDADVNGTLLRYVLAGGVFANHALIQEGLARVEMPAPDTACLRTLLAAEQHARAQSRGLWNVSYTPTSAP